MIQLFLVIFFFSGCATTAPKTEREQVDAALKSHDLEFKFCYEHELNAGVKVGSGKVILEWTLQPNGHPFGAMVEESTLKNKKVEQCLVDEVNKVEFPKPAAPVAIKYPFTFK